MPAICPGLKMAGAEGRSEGENQLLERAVGEQCAQAE